MQSIVDVGIDVFTVGNERNDIDENLEFYFCCNIFFPTKMLFIVGSVGRYLLIV